MPNAAQILADSTNLLKHDPAVASQILHPPAPLSRLGCDLAKLCRMIRRAVPEDGQVLDDPVRHLQLAIDDAIHGKNRRGVCLEALVDQTNRHDPLVGILGEVRLAREAISDLYRRQRKIEPVVTWPDAGASAGACSDAPLCFEPTIIAAHDGYRINFFELTCAAEWILEIASEAGEDDPRSQVAYAIVDLMGACLLPFRDLINSVTDEQATEFRRDRHNRELFVMKSR